MKPSVLIAATLTAVFVVGCGEAAKAPQIARIAVTAAGRIGPLRVRRSMRADVIAFAGRPQSERHGRWGEGPILDALGYRCRGRPHAIDLQAWCRTVFWLDTPTGTVALFYTTDSVYATPNDLRVGTPLPRAEHALHATARPACGGRQLRVSTRHGYLVLWGVGDVGFMAVHAKGAPLGVTDCSDPMSVGEPGFN